MPIQKSLNIEEKLELLGSDAKYDLSCGVCGEGRKRLKGIENWIYPAVLPNGKTQYMLKVLMSNACKYNCSYCAQRANRAIKRTSLSPEELSSIFHQLLCERKVAALFISSAIFGDTIRVMDRMLKTAEIVRKRLGFRGYLHLKLLPGIEHSQIERALQLADRVSVNFEAVSDTRLCKIAPEKRLSGGLLDVMRNVSQMLNSPHESYVCRGASTQFVVGPAGENDQELVTAANRIYGHLGLKRIYYSAHTPVPDTPLEGDTATPLWREHRLYQADFLLRKYSFQATELVFNDSGNFDEVVDPKTAWALKHPEWFPLEVNKAPLEELIRVPGIGPNGAKKIVNARLGGKIIYPDQLVKLGVRADNATPFLLFNGFVRENMNSRGQMIFRFIGDHAVKLPR